MKNYLNGTINHAASFECTLFLGFIESGEYSWIPQGPAPIEPTPTQVRIFERERTVYGYKNRPLKALRGAGEHRSADTLVNLGVARTCSCQPHMETFIYLKDGYRYNFVTRLIEWVGV